MGLPIFRLPQPLNRHFNRRTAHGYHHHAIGFAQHFVVKIDTDDAVCAQLLRGLLHIRQRRFARAGQSAFITAGAPTNHIADGSKHIAENVCADNRFTVHNAQISI